ncbi:hypothetical protein CRG98_027707 [Punica granatum]|uniref:Uncharacterized protein n=1 Tax=Punica granatum TaxID=22663 RepID=A0A2I0J6M2_PUNGR|nr:hypothetical protein CRG98_027707 [Punica granatum]
MGRACKEREMGRGPLAEARPGFGEAAATRLGPAVLAPGRRDDGTRGLGKGNKLKKKDDFAPPEPMDRNWVLTAGVAPNPELKVHDLMLFHPKRWNIPQLTNLFDQETVENILKMHLQQEDYEDSAL